MFEVSTRAENPTDALAMGDDAKATAPVFVTEQSVFGFAAMTAVVQTVWKVLQVAAGGWAASAWVALAIAGLVGVAQFLPVPKGQSRQVTVRQAIFGLFNVGVLWAAALGIDKQVPEP